MVSFTARSVELRPSVVIFTDTTTFVAGSTFLWNFGDSTTSEERHPVHAYTAPGDYTVTLTITVGGTPSSISNSIKVKPYFDRWDYNCIYGKEIPEDYLYQKFTYTFVLFAHMFHTLGGKNKGELFPATDSIVSDILSPTHILLFADEYKVSSTLSVPTYMAFYCGPLTFDTVECTDPCNFLNIPNYLEVTGCTDPCNFLVIPNYKEVIGCSTPCNFLVIPNFTEIVGCSDPCNFLVIPNFAEQTPVSFVLAFQQATTKQVNVGVSHRLTITQA